MVSNSAKLDCRTKQHTESGVSTSDSSRDMARTRSWWKKKEKKNELVKSHKHPLRGSLISNRDKNENYYVVFSFKVCHLEGFYVNSLRKEFVTSAVYSTGFPLFSWVKRSLVAMGKEAGRLLNPFLQRMTC